MTSSGSWQPWTLEPSCSSIADQPQIMRVIKESPLMDRLISHVMPMSRIQQAFELPATGESAKVILKPWE